MFRGILLRGKVKRFRKIVRNTLLLEFMGTLYIACCSYNYGVSKGILFVCLGNICRSPLAEGVFQHLVEQRGLQDRYMVSSAGTRNWNVGDPPDHRMVATARRHGIKLMSRAQQITMQDLNSFDLLLAMDRTNREDLQYMAQNEPRLVHVRLLRDFDLLSSSNADIPDPYFGDPAGFESVYQIVERACVGLLSALEDE